MRGFPLKCVANVNNAWPNPEIGQKWPVAGYYFKLDSANKMIIPYV